MRNRLIAATGAALAIMAISGAAPALASGNPNGTGPPSQSCQDIEAAGGNTPGNAATSPGSPFNEPSINSQNRGTGGQHYSAKSQYDVACYHVSQH